MKKNPKVSIIIPVYNGKDYMKEAIDSALSQTYKNIEILVINDGSTDDGATKRIAESYGNKIRYFEKENGGVSTALNLAIKNMTGDYFSWLSHDDRYYKNKIESQIEYLKKYDENTIIYTDYDLMDENSNVFAKSIKDHEELTKKPEYALLRGAINGITLLIPRKAFEDCGNFREDLRCTQDYELWKRMMKKYKFVHQPEILGTTRLHKNQTGNTSPYVLKENNDLWMNIIEDISDEDKTRLDNSIYLYYYNMREFIKTTNFDKILDFLDNKVNNLEKQIKKDAKKVLVSVVIPYYNNKLEIQRAINSVLKQTHKLIEIIIVDDGSNERLEQSEIKNKSIKLYRFEKNKGVSAARNYGIEKAKGDYIAFLDADDEFMPQKIENQLIYMLKTNTKFSYTSYMRCNYNEVKINCDCENINIKNKCISNCDIATPTVMLEKRLLEKYNIKYKEKIHYGEDVIFYLEIFKYTNPIILNEYLTKVYVDINSAFNNKMKQIEGTKNILTYLLNDEDYNMQIVEISKLCYEFYKMLNFHDDDNQKNSNEKLQQVNGTLLIEQSKLKKYLNTLHTKGLKYCIIRVFKKIIGK